MEIVLDTITSVSRQLVLCSTPEELELKLDLASLKSNVDYVLTARRVDDEIFLDGILSFAISFNCARCLEEFVASYRLPLNLVIQLVPDEESAGVEEATDEFIIFPESRKVYSLDQHLRDLITLELPMKPLCKVDCRGLCPNCGTNLNLSRCSCKHDEADPRWDELRKLYHQ